MKSVHYTVSTSRPSMHGSPHPLLLRPLQLRICFVGKVRTKSTVDFILMARYDSTRLLPKAGQSFWNCGEGGVIMYDVTSCRTIQCWGYNIGENNAVVLFFDFRLGWNFWDVF